MSETVLVSIPEALYHRARELARARHQSTEVVISEALAQGLAPNAVYPAIPSVEDEAVMAGEIAAYESMHNHLLATHAGLFVAFFQGQLIDHDPDETALIRRLDAAYPDKVVLVRRVEPLPERELRLRSPRLEREPR